MGRVRDISNEAQYQSELNSAGFKLVVVDFTASWCGPCQRIAPHFDRFSLKYPQAVFLKVDVDANQGLAASQQVSAMPTFILYKNKVKVDRLQGADSVALEAKIRQLYEAGDGEPSEVAGHMELSTFVLKDQCSSLNETDGSSIANVLADSETFIESDCDEQLILSFTFSQRVKIHSIKLKAPSDTGPKIIKLFVNLPGNLDFSSAESLKPLQELELTEADLNGKPISLRFVKFQNVNSIDLFITKNQCEGEVTRVNYISFIGSPITSTNMDDFKKVTDKKGEGHA